MFSPYYAWSRDWGRKSGANDPENFVALNVAVYGDAGKRWTLTERSRESLYRRASSFVVGPSALEWRGDALRILIDEVAVPIPRRVRGTVTVRPRELTRFVTKLDSQGRHRWGPIAASAHVEVDLAAPAARWTGQAYFDSNEGDEPIETPFSDWDWSRAKLADGSTAVLYDVRERSGQNNVIALRCGPTGAAEPFAPPPRQTLPASRIWRIARATHSEPGAPASVVETLEDTPFYVRSVLSSTLLGERTTSVHESLSLDRFKAQWVRLMLPFRMPRVR